MVTLGPHSAIALFRLITLRPQSAQLEGFIGMICATWKNH